ncbi:MAG: hypothetical protein KDD40_06865, partial [Bdellovibrionales bacterium]|nr:hypothetical protein [Bdellovibrionales bacterium]
MKSAKLFVIITFAVLPLLYLNCQGKFKATSSSSFSSQCIAKTEKIQNQKPQPHFYKQLPKPSKLLLSANPFLSKSLEKLNVQLGVPFAVMINPKCVSSYTATAKTVSLSPSQKITQNKRLETSVNYQTFPWTIRTQTDLEQFEVEINADPCVYAAGLDLNYNISSYPQTPLDDVYLSQQGHLPAIQAESSYEIFYHPEKGVQQLNDSQR